MPPFVVQTFFPNDRGRQWRESLEIRLNTGAHCRNTFKESIRTENNGMMEGENNIKFNKNELKGSVAAVFFVLFVLFCLRILYFVILSFGYRGFVLFISC